jgi:hypothetical protein
MLPLAGKASPDNHLLTVEIAKEDSTCIAQKARSN